MKFSGGDLERIRHTLLNECPDLLFYCHVDVDKHVTKKNNRSIFKNRKTGRMYPGKSKELVSAEEHMISEMAEQWRKFGGNQPLNMHIWCVFIFFFNHRHYYTKNGTINRRIGDLSNLIQLPEDCLQKAGIIKDDSLIMSLDLSRKFPGESNYLELFILPYDNEEDEEPSWEKYNI